MKIREGAYYKDRTGKIVGPMRRGDHPVYLWLAGVSSWTSDGEWRQGRISSHDLVEEVSSSAENAPVMLRQVLEAGERIREDDEYYDPLDEKWKPVGKADVGIPAPHGSYYRRGGFVPVAGSEPYQYAVNLLHQLFDRMPNAETAPPLQVSSDLVGVLTQIDHLTAGMDFRPTEPKTWTRCGVLAEALRSVDRRDETYGKPEDNFARICGLWNLYLHDRPGGRSEPITERDVALMMTLLKVARLQQDPTHADSWVDIAGYAACGGSMPR